MKLLALDFSTCTGWVVLEGERGKVPRIIASGRIEKDESFVNPIYPWRPLQIAMQIAKKANELLQEHHPEVVVIEETNKGKNRYSQKQLEWIHFAFLSSFAHFPNPPKNIFYINTSDWRKILGTGLTKEDKKLNAKVRKLWKAGDRKGIKNLGVRGKVNKKHTAIRYVNSTYGLDLKMKDNDIADAICIGTSYFLGVAVCDGK
jgi:Holliday junction resolvasome RuvABC endonuclease subunit